MSTSELCSEYCEKLRVAVYDEDARTIVKTLLKVLANVMKNPGVEKYRVIRKRNKVFQSLESLYVQALEYLTIVGFKEKQVEQEPKFVLNFQEEDPQAIETGMKVLKALAADLDIASADIPSINIYNKKDFEAARIGARKQADAVNGFNFYQSNVQNISGVPTQNGSNSRMEDQVETLKAKQRKMMEDAGIPDRMLRIIPSGSGINPRNFKDFVHPEESQSLPVPKSDGAIVLQANKMRRKEQKKNAEFRTKAMRELEKLRNARVFTKVIIRVQLPDKSVVEAQFSPVERIDDVASIVRESLLDSVDEQFYLYTTPPRKVLPLDKTLDELGLKPAALLYLGWKSGAPSGSFLREDLMVDPNESREFPSSKPLDETNKSEGAKKKATSSGKPKWLKI